MTAFEVRAKVSYLLFAVAVISLATCVVLLGASFAMWAKSALSFASAMALSAIAMPLLRQDFPGRLISTKTLFKALGLGAIFLVILTRGAPHNNAGLYAVYEQFGAGALAFLASAVFLAGIGFALTAGRHWNPRSVELGLEHSWTLVLAVLGLGAVLGAAHPILAAWDQPSWGDALSYDSYAHRIALGQLPAGGSEYMPLYQYGTAAIYWTFGHIFFAQQLANLVFAPLTVILLASAARQLFNSSTAGFVTGILSMSHDYLRYTPNMLTIENWYIPALALTAYASARYLTGPTYRFAVLVAFAAGLLFSIRLQGAFYCAFLLLVPFFVRDLSWVKRVRHFVIGGIVFAVILTPWTIRNAVIDGHISPGTAAKSGRQMALTGDRRVFYGIRRAEKTDEIVKEWADRYPKEDERARAQALDGWLRPFVDPKFVWLEAVPWRFLAFYGLLPPGIWDPEGVRRTDWSREGLAYSLQVGPVALLLLASLIGFFYVRPRRIGIFLLAGIGANLAIIIWAGFSEARVSYPVYPLHMILAAALFVTINPSSAVTQNTGATLRQKYLIGTIAVFALAVGINSARSNWGDPYRLRPLNEYLKLTQHVEIDGSLPDITCGIYSEKNGKTITDLNRLNRVVRFRAILTNNHFPIKYFGLWSNRDVGSVPGFPQFTSDPRRETYFFAILNRKDCPHETETSPSMQLGVAFAGALADRQLQEGDVIEVSGIVKSQRHTTSERRMWIWAREARLLERSGQRNF